MPIEIDQWAHQLAARVGCETGWRASDIYAWLTCTASDHSAREGVLTRIQSARIAGESFPEALQRFETVTAEIERRLAARIWASFYRCPTTGRIIEALHGDDKVLCNCGRSNPRVPAERTEQTGTHIIRFLAEVSVDDYLAQREADRATASPPS